MIEERNDALKLGYKFPIERYSFACKMLTGLYVADCGCGMGYGTKMLEAPQNRVIGIDKFKDAIKYAVENYKISAIVGDIVKLDYTGFNAVVCLEALCHLKRPKDFLKKVQGKKIVISAPLDPNPNDGYHYRYWNFNEDEFRGLLTDWILLDGLRQNDNGQVYLTLYGIPKS